MKGENKPIRMSRLTVLSEVIKKRFSETGYIERT